MAGWWFGCHQFRWVKIKQGYHSNPYLVGGLVAINFIFPYIGLLIIPIDALIFFRGVAQPPTSFNMGLFPQLVSQTYWDVCFSLLEMGDSL